MNLKACPGRVEQCAANGRRSPKPQLQAAGCKGGVSHATAVLGAPNAASQSYDVDDAVHELGADGCS